MISPNQSLEVSVWRGGSAGGDYEHYSVPRRESQTVLDVVTWIQHNAEPKLTYRFACRVGMCGSCAMMVNGVPRWTCRTHVSKVADEGKLEIAPLANMPVIKDLACDMSEFFEKWQTARGRFEPTRTRDDPMEPVRPDTPERMAASAGIECINCGICYAACDTVRWNPEYLGPAALNRAWTLVNDERDGGRAEHLIAVSRHGGCHSCRSHQSCEAHCPNELNPAASIAGLKRLSVSAYLKGDLK